jgi:hypothetical protein
MRRRIVALLAMAVIAVAMLAASAPVFAQGEGSFPCDPNPGGSEGSLAPQGTPPQGKPGTARRDSEGAEHDTHDRSTGFGNLVDECA